MAKPESKLVGGVRVDATTGAPIAQSTDTQAKNLAAINSPVIPLSTLNSNQTPAVTLPQPIGETSALEASLSALPDKLTAQAQVSQKNEASSFEDYMKGYLEMDTPSQIRARVEKEQGVLDLDKQNEALKSELTALDEQLRKQVERIQTAPGTATAAERDREVGEITRVNRRQRADIAITQLAQQGQLDAAQRYADTLVNEEKEFEEKKLGALQLSYERNKELFTRDEQREFETAQADRQEAINFEYQKKAAEYQQQIKQSDPLYKLQLQKAAQELDSGSVTITNPAAGAYTGALNVILGSGKFTKDQKASLITAVNNGEDPFAVIKNQAKTILGQAGETKLTSYEVAKGQLEKVEESLNAYYAAGGNTNLLNGKYEDVINRLGEVEDPKLVEIATEIAASLQIYRNAVSGTAYSVQEGEDIAKIFPGINKSEGLNKAILAGRMRAFDSTIDDTYRAALGSTYDALKQVDQAGVKADMSDKDFVESSLNAVGASYDEVLKAVPAGQVAVVDNKTGQVGYIEQGEFDSKKYTKL